jgi:hypothetical protein
MYARLVYQRRWLASACAAAISALRINIWRFTAHQLRFTCGISGSTGARAADCALAPRCFFFAHGAYRRGAQRTGLVCLPRRAFYGSA